MNPPASADVSAKSGKALWAARLRRFGKTGVSIVLIGIGVLWCHELFQDPQVRQKWKLQVLMVLIPLGATASLSLGLAWVLHRPSGGKR